MSMNLLFIFCIEEKRFNIRRKKEAFKLQAIIYMTNYLYQ